MPSMRKFMDVFGAGADYTDASEPTAAFNKTLVYANVLKSDYEKIADTARNYADKLNSQYGPGSIRADFSFKSAGFMSLDGKMTVTVKGAKRDLFDAFVRVLKGLERHFPLIVRER